MEKLFLGKRSLVAFVVSVAILGFIFVYKNDSINEGFLSFNRPADEAAIDPVIEDPDGDGLIKWEEDAWGTDPNNADTDGDGTPDEEEINLGRNPTIPGPDDSLASTYSRINSADKAAGSINLTEQVASQISKNTLDFYTDEGGAKNVFDVETGFSDTLDAELATIKLPNTYTPADLTIVPETPASLVSYANAMLDILKIFESDLSPIYGELNVLAEALNEGNVGGLSRIDESIPPYNNIISSMIALSVPSTLSKNHLLTVNSLWKIRENILAMKLTIEDPLLGLASTKSYYSEQENVLTIVNEIFTYVKEHGYTFDEATGQFIAN